MRLKRKPRRVLPENTIPLINVVFLMLIFFLFAGSIARDDARRIAPPQSLAEDERVRSTGALVIDRDGRLYIGDAETSIEAVAETIRSGDSNGEPFKLAADGALPASELNAVLARLSEAGLGEAVLITRRASQ